MKVLGLGNALVDILIKLPTDKFLEEHELPRGSMQLIDDVKKESLLSASSDISRDLASGGSAANTIHGLANLGVSTAYIGKINEDKHGEFFRNDLIEAGIEPKLFKGEQSTGTAITFISEDSERTFGTYLGAATELTPADLSADLFKGYDLMHVEGYLVFNQELIEHALKMAKQSNLKISLDLASYNVVEANLDFLKMLVDEYVDIVFANEEEAKAFTGLEPEEALDIFAEKCEIAVVKVGKDGAFIKSGNEKHKVGVIDAKRMDTTGAGDLYAAGFIYGMSEEFSLKDSAYIGSILAGKVIERIGAKIDEAGYEHARSLIADLFKDEE